jgi:hypothetical protein
MQKTVLYYCLIKVKLRLQNIMMIQQVIDFGLVVLIWIVQIIVYPSFSYYKLEDLSKWHEKYTRNITLIVLPLMTVQLGIHLYEIISALSFLRLVILIMILLIWINTFLYSVPLHKRISGNVDMAGACRDLSRINWYRTVLWTLVFVLGFFVV